MKNIILASVVAFGFAAIAQENAELPKQDAAPVAAEKNIDKKELKKELKGHRPVKKHAEKKEAM